jgi:hypothetical protein
MFHSNRHDRRSYHDKHRAEPIHIQVYPELTFRIASTGQQVTREILLISWYTAHKRDFDGALEETSLQE